MLNSMHVDTFLQQMGRQSLAACLSQVSLAQLHGDFFSQLQLKSGTSSAHMIHFMVLWLKGNHLFSPRTHYQMQGAWQSQCEQAWKKVAPCAWPACQANHALSQTRTPRCAGLKEADVWMHLASLSCIHNIWAAFCNLLQGCSQLGPCAAGLIHPWGPPPRALLDHESLIQTWVRLQPIHTDGSLSQGSKCHWCWSRGLILASNENGKLPDNSD